MDFGAALRFIKRLNAARHETPALPSAPPKAFTALLTADELDGGWIAECVEIPSAMSQGETREEAIQNLIDAILDVMAVRMAKQVPSFPEERPGR